MRNTKNLKVLFSLMLVFAVISSMFMTVMAEPDTLIGEGDENVIAEVEIEAEETNAEETGEEEAEMTAEEALAYVEAYDQNTATEEDAAKLTKGTKIAVKGYKATFNGEVEIVDGTFTFVEGGDTFVAEALDVTNLLGTEDMEKHQNEFVSFKGMTVNKIEYKNGEPGDDIYVTLDKDGKSYSFCVEIYLTGKDSEVYTTVGTLEAGDVVDVEAFLYWYEGMNPHITSVKANG